ncbi:hypothetical protein GCM10009557_06050 [Virgisporangium ochraceum]|uniref:Uncharacterized protein n=1 Tax=Virgisporangium ochraceum TaxID=65505 RepID=A0A8J3ZNP7_9ACTN|nr:hypothetical protein Voc01_011790 [Virgisporangium ochraceum]
MAIAFSHSDRQQATCTQTPGTRRFFTFKCPARDQADTKADGLKRGPCEFDSRRVHDAVGSPGRAAGRIGAGNPGTAPVRDRLARQAKMITASMHDNSDYRVSYPCFLSHLASAAANALILIGGLLIQAGAGA